MAAWWASLAPSDDGDGIAAVEGDGHTLHVGELAGYEAPSGLEPADRTRPSD